MPDTDPRAAAIEAALAAAERIDDQLFAAGQPVSARTVARAAVAAAVPHLTRDLRALAAEAKGPRSHLWLTPQQVGRLMTRALDALERGEDR